ncbi:hypothetical protein DUNSADRAFT_15791 [Dunaliella salina]|uniref:Uncharacterized protein n=1 Tax=Dunaliella salina TaxID=3046 RepID=A0ABQ7H1G8_DUNSA|nr:hypothetical protein DUNSADRAFT_15791 [Dunaliella salina]|eukprot:KAF5840696.1 hypothetical protein DUNSADRAFT_15791 [Dunaliella salina]
MTAKSGLLPGLEKLVDDAGIALKYSNNDLEEEEEEEEANEASAIEGMLKQIIEKRKEAEAQKQAAMINETASKIRANADAVEAAIVKDSKDSSSLARSSFSKVEAGLDKIAKQIVQCSAQYEADMHALWKAYNDQFEQLSTCQQEVKVATDKKRAATKRKLTALTNDSQKQMAEAEERLSKIRSKSTKLPGVLQVLQSLMDQ